MKINFEIKDDGSIPVVYVDGSKLSLISLTYAWHTKTDDVYNGANICIVDGFLNDEIIPRRFLLNILDGIATEESILDTCGRKFEVCIDPGTSIETEIWIQVPFKNLKKGDLIRIIDNGVYYKDLEGNALFVVDDTSYISQDKIRIIPFVSIDTNETST